MRLLILPRMDRILALKEDQILVHGHRMRKQLSMYVRGALSRPSTMDVCVCVCVVVEGGKTIYRIYISLYIYIYKYIYIYILKKMILFFVVHTS